MQVFGTVGQVLTIHIVSRQVPVMPPAIASMVGSSKFRRVTFLISSFLVFFNLTSFKTCGRRGQVQDAS
jgi:hypothetical protein